MNQCPQRGVEQAWGNQQNLTGRALQGYECVWVRVEEGYI
jgi:hypothetical protein